MRKGGTSTLEAKVKADASKRRAGNRKCTRCKLVFYKDKGVLQGLCPRCRERCKRCDVLLTNSNRVNYSKKKTALYLCLACREETHGLKYKGKAGKDYRLNKDFGITIQEYEAILNAQNGSCWICNRVPTGNSLAVDHLHSKGENKRNPREKRARIRGLLCWRCNASIGKFQDSPVLLRKAAQYLEEWPAQKFLKEATNADK